MKLRRKKVTPNHPRYFTLNIPFDKGELFKQTCKERGCKIGEQATALLEEWIGVRPEKKKEIQQPNEIINYGFYFKFFEARREP